MRRKPRAQSLYERVPTRFLRPWTRWLRVPIDIPECLVNVGVRSRDERRLIPQLRDKQGMEISYRCRSSVRESLHCFRPVWAVIFGVATALLLKGQIVKQMWSVRYERRVLSQTLKRSRSCSRGVRRNRIGK